MVLVLVVTDVSYYALKDVREVEGSVPTFS
jgi:hypothetical protein